MKFEKDPDAVLDYQINWAVWLDGDTIVTSDWVLPADTDIVEDDSSNTTTTATIWLSAGTAGQRYPITNRITTAGGRTDDRTIYIQVVER